MHEPETDDLPSVETERLSPIHIIKSHFNHSETTSAFDLSQITAVSEARWGDRHRDHRILVWIKDGERDGIVVPFRNYDKAREEQVILVNAWKAYRGQRP